MYVSAVKVLERFLGEEWNHRSYERHTGVFDTLIEMTKQRSKANPWMSYGAVGRHCDVLFLRGHKTCVFDLEVRRSYTFLKSPLEAGLARALKDEEDEVIKNPFRRFVMARERNEPVKMAVMLAHYKHCTCCPYY